MGVANDYAGQGRFFGKVLIGQGLLPYPHGISLIPPGAEPVEIVYDSARSAGLNFLRGAVLVRAQGRGEETVAERGFFGRHAAGGGS